MTFEEMTFEEFMQSEFMRLINRIFVFKRNDAPHDNEARVLYGIYINLTYDEMKGNSRKQEARNFDRFEPDANNIGKRVLDIVREVLQEIGILNETETLDKRNFRSNLEIRKNTIVAALDVAEAERTASNSPNINKPYIERKIVSLCESYLIENPGGIAHVRGGPKTGKTTTVNKVVKNVRERQDYQSSLIDLRDCIKFFTNKDTFMENLCRQIIVNSENLDSSFNKEQYDEALDEADGDWTFFLKNNLLSKIERPLVLVIDNFHKLFEYPDIFTELCCTYLRPWYDKAKQSGDIGETWGKLRVVLVYYDIPYPEVPPNRSPFNVGEYFDLKDFELNQVTALAEQYELKERWEEDLENPCTTLRKLVGGHPYFISLAFQNFKTEQTTLKNLLNLASTEEGIYSRFLKNRLTILRQDNKLVSAYQKVLSTKSPIEIMELGDRKIFERLRGLEFIKIIGDKCEPRYVLYRQYFSKHLDVIQSQDEDD